MAFVLQKKSKIKDPKLQSSFSPSTSIFAAYDLHRVQRCLEVAERHSDIGSFQAGLSLDKNAAIKKHMTFRISPGTAKRQEYGYLQAAILNVRLAHYVLYVKCQRHCVDLCMFDTHNRFLFSYLDSLRQHRQKSNDLSHCHWGSELFGLNNNPCGTTHMETIDISSEKDLECDLKKTHTEGQSHRAYEGGSMVVHCDEAYHLTQNADLAAAIVTTCKASPMFLGGLQRVALHNSVRSPVECIHGSRRSGLEGGSETRVPVGIVIHLTELSQGTIDHAWEVRMHHLVGKKGVLDDAMSWLNTLGGGYSALGDYFKHHAEQAAKISMKQLRVAMDMGDPPTVIRCHLYFGLSLMQRGDLRTAKRIIRYQYGMARQVAASDARLQASCHGLWSRLRYLYSLRGQRSREQPSG